MSFVGGQEWMTELQRKFIVMRSFLLGQTRSSREVTPIGFHDFLLFSRDCFAEVRCFVALNALRRTERNSGSTARDNSVIGLEHDPRIVDSFRFLSVKTHQGYV